MKGVLPYPPHTVLAQPREGNDETVAKESYDMGKQSKLDLAPRLEDVLTPIVAKS